jgi:signal transduction histidine kinase
MLILDEQANLIDCNHSAERLIGQSRHDSVGVPLADLFEADSIGPLWASLREKENLHIRDAVLVRRADLQPILVEVWGRLIGDHWILMAHNVEQRRELDQQVARIRRMDSIGSLASTLAHDFNNLLGQIQILVSHLKSEAPPGSELEGDVGAIEKKVDDATQLVSNLLASRETVASREPVWIEPVLKEFAADQPKVLPDRIRLSVDVRSDMPSIWITPHALRRVLDNLCRNACDAMPYGGTLTLRAYGKRIDASSSTEQLPADHYTILEVSDTGAGMSREVLESIFDPFFTTKGQGQGMGLGLWTVYRIIRRVDGLIQVHSRVGKGTQFTIYLPHRAPKPKDAHRSRIGGESWPAGYPPEGHSGVLPSISWPSGGEPT